MDDEIYTEGVMDDGAAILRDGELMTISEVLAALNSSENLRSALEAIVHAVCGETGFANAVRIDSGTAYPWEALEIAEVKARDALSRATG